VDGHDPPGGAARTSDGPPLAEPLPELAGDPSTAAPAPAAVPGWSVLGLLITAVASFFAMTSAQLVTVLALGVAGRDADQRSPADILAVTAAGAVALLVVLALVGRRFLHLAPDDLGLRRPTLGQLRFAVASAVALWISSILVNVLWIQLVGARPQALVVSFGTHRGPEALFLDLLTGAVVAPLAEETLYRGIVFGGLAQRLPFAVAAAVSALLFALAHGIGVLAPIFVLGFGLAWIYRRSGTLWAPIVAHATVNAISLALLFALPRPLA